MQVTELQVQRSLEALTTPGSPLEPGDPHAPDGEASAPPDADLATDVAPEQLADELPAGLVEQLLGSSAVRPERLAEARQRLETGDQPTAEDVAQRLVGRLVCDRLR
jgi:hypothetical protein